MIFKPDTSILKTTDEQTITAIPSSALEMIQYILDKSNTNLEITYCNGRYSGIREQLKARPLDEFITESDEYYRNTDGIFGISAEKVRSENRDPQQLKSQYMFMQNTFAVSNYEEKSLRAFFISILTDDNAFKQFRQSVDARIDAMSEEDG